MEKSLLTYLVPIILVIGTAFGAGMVIADDEDSDVTVGVGYVAPEIEIDEPEEGDSFGWQDEVYIKATVTAPGQDTVVEDIEFEFEYVGEKNAGEAVTNVYEDGLEVDEWVEDEGQVDHTFVLSDGQMWRAGPWEVTATVYGTEGDQDSDTEEVAVDDYLKIHWAEDGEASGGQGDELYGDDFDVPDNGIPSDNQDHPEINITSNNNWELILTPGVAVHETEGDDYTLDVEGSYAYDLGTPVMGDVIEINYYVYIPYGHMHGQYSTAYPEGESVHHELKAYCMPLPEETAWGGDSMGDGWSLDSGGGGQWWYYYDTSGDEEQKITAGRDIEIGIVAVSEPENGEVTITIELNEYWKLQDDHESVKIQVYEEGDLPCSAPTPGLFDTYKGYELEVTIEPDEDFEYYAIHLDVFDLRDNEV